MKKKTSEPKLWQRIKPLVHWGERVELADRAGFPDCVVALNPDSETLFLELKAPAEDSSLLGLAPEQVAWFRRAVTGGRRVGLLAMFPTAVIGININGVFRRSGLVDGSELLLKDTWHPDYCQHEEQGYVVRSIKHDADLLVWLRDRSAR